jgi:hypothetical protein
LKSSLTTAIYSLLLITVGYYNQFNHLTNIETRKVINIPQPSKTAGSLAPLLRAPVGITSALRGKGIGENQ